MPYGARSGRIAARVAWDAIQRYLKSKNDKSTQFQSYDLELMGVEGYRGNGLFRLSTKGIIKKVGAKQNHGGGGLRNMYTVADDMLKHPLDEILSFSYMDVSRKFGQ